MTLANIAPVDWELKVNLHEFDIIDYPLRVTGETHIGGVIFQLVEKLNHIRNDWSDFALWWPDKNQWLNKTKMTLDQYGVQADALLIFTRLHKTIHLKMPDQQVVSVKIDASVNLFNGIKQICKELGIRHSEEVSLLRYNVSTLSKTVSNEKKAHQKDLTKLQSTNLNAKNGSHSNEETNLNKENDSLSSNSTLNHSISTSSNNGNGVFKFTRERSQSLSIENANVSSLNGLSDNNVQTTLVLSPILSTQDHLQKNGMKYKNLFDKSKINSRWIDSSKSLMEHRIKDNDLIQLRFKYYAFLDLNLKVDLIRINQIYEQAKWSILSEEIDCTETELIKFAALQVIAYIFFSGLTSGI